MGPVAVRGWRGWDVSVHYLLVLPALCSECH